VIIIGPIGLIIALMVISWLFRDSDFLSCVGCFVLVILIVAALGLGEHWGWWDTGVW